MILLFSIRTLQFDGTKREQIYYSALIMILINYVTLFVDVIILQLVDDFLIIRSKDIFSTSSNINIFQASNYFLTIFS